MFSRRDSLTAKQILQIFQPFKYQPHYLTVYNKVSTLYMSHKAVFIHELSTNPTSFICGLLLSY